MRQNAFFLSSILHSILYSTGGFRIFMKKSLLIFSLCLATCAALAEPEIKGTPEELAGYLKDVPKTAFVAGESEVKVQADRAVISLKVRTESKSLQEALRQNQEIRGKIINFLSEHAVPADRVQAAKFSSTPKYGVFGDKAKSYQVDNTVKVTVNDEKEFRAVANAADNWAEVHYDGVEFQHSNKEELKAKAMRQACENSLARKKIFEETLGVKLTPKGFFENAEVRNVLARVGAQGGTAPSFQGVPSASYDGLLSSRKERSRTSIPSGDSGFEETMSTFGELTFKATVVVEYSVETKK